MHRAQLLIASCAPVLLDFGVPDVRTILQIQTYRTLSKLSRKHAVVKDDAASVRVYNCNVALTVCVETGLGQIAKLLGARAELRMSCAFRTGKFGKKVVDVKVGIDLEMTVKEQQRRVRHESGEGEMERYDTHVQQPF